MKAVVVEIKDNKAAVLSDDGRVIAISNQAYAVGQVIEVKHSGLSLVRKLAVYGASAAAVILLGFSSWAYASPYTYVSVDVNPSIEYSVNRFDRVLSIKGVNDDGEDIIEKIELKELKYQAIEKAVLETVEQITAEGYFTDDMEGGIVITTASEDEEKAEELAASLQQQVAEEVHRTEEDVLVEANSLGLERVEEAKQLGVTPGKLNLVEKLQATAADPASIDIEQWLDRPVKEIMKATKDNRLNESDSETVIQKEENTSSDSDDNKAQAKVDRKEQKQEKKAEESSKDHKQENKAEEDRKDQKPEKKAKEDRKEQMQEKKVEENRKDQKQEKKAIEDRKEQKPEKKTKEDRKEQMQEKKVIEDSKEQKPEKKVEKAEDKSNKNSSSITNKNSDNKK